ncbi:uncharacterized protein [Hyperolius riggenbachi]|uniref:uncharacterized protein n=1 Tax=Hyperolius riggenbachi TaxID=752182 RepID=UPI0035A34CEF
MSLTHVKWSDTEYSLQEYVFKFRTCFPSIIKITEGFLGKQEIDSVSSSTIIRVHSLYNQKRIVAETRSGKLFSLPIKLTRLKFVLLQASSSTTNLLVPMTLEEILANSTLPVVVRTAKALSYKQKGETTEDEKMSELTLQDTYEESFLFGHPIDKGKIFTDEPIIVPMYMKELRLAVAEGLANGNIEEWSMVCEWLSKEVNNKGLTNVTFQEIFMLDKKDLSPQEPRYSSIEPIYIDISEINSDKTTPLDNKGRCNVYESHLIPELKEVQLKQAQHVNKTDSSAVKPGSPAIKPESPVYKPESLPHTTGSLTNKPTPTEPKTESPSVNSFTTINDVPKNLRNLTVKQISECLKLLNMSQYAEAFESSQVDGHLVYDLDDEMMKSCLGMNGLNVVKFKKFRDGWRPNLQG